MNKETGSEIQATTHIDDNYPSGPGGLFYLPDCHSRIAYSDSPATDRDADRHAHTTDGYGCADGSAHRHADAYAAAAARRHTKSK